MRTLVWLLFESSAFLLTPKCVRAFLFGSTREKKPSEVTECYRCSSSCLSFEFECYLQLMPARHVAVKTADLQPGTDNDWVVSGNKRSRANIIVWGLRKDLSTLEVVSAPDPMQK